MPQNKRKETTNSKEQPVQKQQRVLSVDTQWCIENKSQLTLKAFVNHFGYLEKQKAITRYRTIINNYICESKAELLEEIQVWKQTASWDEFWMEKQRELAKLNTQKSCLDYVINTLSAETASVTGPIVSCTSTSETENDSSKTDVVSTDSISAKNSTDTLSLTNQQKNDSYSSISTSPWIVAGIDLARVSAEYRQAAQQARRISSLNVGRSLQDILSLADVLLLCPNQHSEMMTSHIDKVDEVTQVLISKTLDKDLDWKDCEFLELSRAISKLAKRFELVDSVERSMAIDETELQLQKLASELHPIKKAIVKGIIGMIGKLPAYALKDEKCIGENELICSYFDPILSRIFSNPGNGTHLRWSDVTVAETSRKRPDAVISKINQLSFGPSLGFGEAKVKNTANYDLCHDLLRLALFSKESIDMNKLSGCLSFQIHGFFITFYIMQLQHTGIYTMIEIGHLALPRSITELPTFINLTTLTNLLHVGDAFWRLCRIANDPAVITSRFTPTNSCLYELISASKCSARECSIRFEK